MDAVNVALSKPINDKGQPVAAITLQPVAGEHLRRFGCPFDILVDDGAIRFNGPVVSALISVLANIPLPAVDQMDGRDWWRCAQVIWGFFSGAVPATPPAT